MSRCAELEGAEDANENALFLACNYGPGYVLYIEIDERGLVLKCPFLYQHAVVTLLVSRPTKQVQNPVTPAPTITTSAIKACAVSSHIHTQYINFLY